ncbi:MAG: 6-carboxyhexanoate--CoA ligase [Romboutsia sp.]
MSLYSVKMRASKDNKHISGAENIVLEEDLNEAISLLVKRAMIHTKGKSDYINLKIEAIKEEELEYITPLKVTTVEVDNHIDGLNAMKKVMIDLGIDGYKCDKIVDMLNNMNNMRGAILLDVNTLERLEPNKERGIRATYMDFESSNLNHLTKDKKYNSHFIEALALATKVINAPNIIGEICYSDDPNYTAGYIASRKYGYIRFPHLKEYGKINGGRIFLYESSNKSRKDVDSCIEYIEKTKVLIKKDINFNDNVRYKKIVGNID